jgi:integrase
MPLTDTRIKTAKAKNQKFSLPDSQGLRLDVTSAGGKLWRWKYRFEGKEKLMAFGRYPEVSLLVARQRHSEGRKLLASGIDPMAARKARKTAEQVSSSNSFATISAQWLEHWSDGKSPRHVDSVRRRMAVDILPCVGRHPITEIEAPALVEMVKAIERRGARDIAKRTLQMAGQVFRFAIAHGYAKRNPAGDIRPSDILKATRSINYARIDAKELPDLLRRIEVYRGTHLTRLAIKLMALTFVRTGELVGARWSEFNIEEERWDIPLERMKMRTPHIVPLSNQAMEVLDLLRPLSGTSELLFPGDRSPTVPMSNNTILKALDRMGYKGRMTGHGFRGLASTLLHEQGFSHDHIELQLAHAPRNAVSAAYNHALHLNARKKMMQDWADFLERTQRGAKVLKFREEVVA